MGGISQMALVPCPTSLIPRVSSAHTPADDTGMTLWLNMLDVLTSITSISFVLSLRENVWCLQYRPHDHHLRRSHRLNLPDEYLSACEGWCSHDETFQTSISLPLACEICVLATLLPSNESALQRLKKMLDSEEAVNP